MLIYTFEQYVQIRIINKILLVYQTVFFQILERQNEFSYILIGMIVFQITYFKNNDISTFFGHEFFFYGDSVCLLKKMISYKYHNSDPCYSHECF